MLPTASTLASGMPPHNQFPPGKLSPDKSANTEGGAGPYDSMRTDAPTILSQMCLWRFLVGGVGVLLVGERTAYFFTINHKQR